MEQEKKTVDVKDLIEKGKQKGSLSNSEIMEAIEYADYDIDQIERLYDQLESSGIDIINYDGAMSEEDTKNELDQMESAKDMEKMLQQEGLCLFVILNPCLFHNHACTSVDQFLVGELHVHHLVAVYMACKNHYRC